jgi:drug/metabolite transporter (DMT)-like permease
VAVLPDIAAAGLYGLVLFLLALGVLVIFVEKVSARRLVGLLLAAGLAALVLATIGEAGLALLAVGFAAALLANQTFEWLTTR